jgi:uncharacterized membrane protein
MVEVPVPMPTHWGTNGNIRHASPQDVDGALLLLLLLLLQYSSAPVKVVPVGSWLVQHSP